MSTDNPTEFDVMGLVIFDRADLPQVSTTATTISAGDTTLSRAEHPSLSYERLRDKAKEYYAIALAIRDAQASPELDRIMTLLKENSAHTHEEAREIALGMIKNGVTSGF